MDKRMSTTEGEGEGETSRPKRQPVKRPPLRVTHETRGLNKVLVGIDEAGRGPLLGRVYVAAVVLPLQTDAFDYSRIKDSKRFHSRKALDATAAYVKERALHWSVMWMDEADIDKYNILEATKLTMQDVALNVVRQVEAAGTSADDVLLMVDGDQFTPVAAHSPKAGRLEVVDHELVRKGDDTYACIAAASILAKSARDAYIDELCDAHPELHERYGLRSNKGYGTAAHMAGLRTHGVSEWHRRSFSPCA